jgi:hypothetical protein
MLVGIGAIAAGPPARADENMWGYSYGAETLPKGRFELYNWTTWRHSKDEGHYDAFDVLFELEYGITDRFQTSTYLAFDGRSQGNLGADGPDDVSGFRFNGLKQAFKYNLLSPYKDPIGLSLYAEPEWMRYSRSSGEREDELALETKLILQKNFFEDTLQWVVNVSPEFEWEFPEDDGTESALVLEATTGLSYRIAPRWFAGLELRYATEFEDYREQEEQAIFFGPNIHYAAERWWLTLAWLPQVWGHPSERGHRNFDAFEKSELRLKIGYNF